MELPIFLGSGLFTVAILLCTCLITLVSLGAMGFFFYRMFKNSSQNNAVLQSGIQAPAVILNVEDTGASMNDNPQVRFTLQVNPPDGRPSFQAVTTKFISRLQIGMINPGSPVTVRYDPNDTTKVTIETLGAPFVPPQK